MGFFGFYGEVLQRSFFEALSLAKTLIFLAVVVVAILGLWWRGIIPLHSRITSGLVGAAVLIAAILIEVPFVVYNMWKEENIARLTAECKLSATSDQSGKHRELVRETLQTFYARAQSLLKAKINKEGFQKWATKYNELTNEMVPWITNTMGPGAASKLQDMNGPSYDYAPIAVNEVHVDVLNWLNKASQNLITLMDDPKWDSFKPNISTDCH
jgi:hypothetical protein